MGTYILEKRETWSPHSHAWLPRWTVIPNYSVRFQGGYYFFYSNGSVQRYAARFSTIGLIRRILPKEGDAFAGISFGHQTKKQFLFVLIFN